jgi:selenide, water dikinase
MAFDLLTTVEYGGCSAKLAPGTLAKALRDLPKPTDPRLLVGITTHDDAGVYRLTDDLALIQTTDFFPPICSDPRTFGRIAAANALSDVYAMGGEVLTALNLAMFPSRKIPLEVLREILLGGQEKVEEAGGVIVGGHTTEDDPPKYGLAVSGLVHPDRIIRNDRATPGEVLLLTKPIGVGVLVAGQRMGVASAADYAGALESMQQLNRAASAIMQAHGVRCATDITGFGLLGHALGMARGSGVTLEIRASDVPLLPGVHGLLDEGCIPGSVFSNLDHVAPYTLFAPDLDPNLKMALADPQTSGGILMAVAPAQVASVCAALQHARCAAAAVIGAVRQVGAACLDVRA